MKKVCDSVEYRKKLQDEKIACLEIELRKNLIESLKKILEVYNPNTKNEISNFLNEFQISETYNIIFNTEKINEIYQDHLEEIWSSFAR